MKMEQIATEIRSQRKRLGLTQEQVAELASCSIPSVIAAEAAKPTLQLNKLIAILTVLGLELTVKVGGE